MEVLRSIEIQVPRDLQALEQVLLQFNQIYQDFIPLRDWLQCRLAFAEGFTNAVRHTHKNLPSNISIRILFSWSNDSFADNTAIFWNLAHNSIFQHHAVVWNIIVRENIINNYRFFIGFGILH